MPQKYVFITAHAGYVSFYATNQFGVATTGSDPVIKPDTSDKVLAKTLSRFKDLGYDVEVRDDRKAKKVVEDYQI